MKRYKLYLTLMMTLLTTAVSAQSPDEGLDTELITPQPKPNDVPNSRPKPFSISTSCDAVAKADIRKGYYKKDHVQFADSEIEATVGFYYNPCFEEGANVGAAYTITYIHWENAPFEQDLFHTVSLSIGGITKRIQGWLWRGQFAANADSPGKDFTGAYVNYDLLFWGRYDYSDCIGVHVGFIGETGMRMDKAYPIFGFDWQISRKWKLNLVYPVDISLDYNLTNRWILAMAARFFDSRHRVKRDEASGRSLVRYENTGIEFAVRYETHDVKANIHVGSTLGGRYRISSPSNKYAHSYKLNPAGYVGADVEVKF